MRWLFRFVRRAAQWLWSHLVEVTVKAIDESLEEAIEVVADMANCQVQRAAAWARLNLTSTLPEGPVVLGLQPTRSVIGPHDLVPTVCGQTT